MVCGVCWAGLQAANSCPNQSQRPTHMATTSARWLGQNAPASICRAARTVTAELGGGAATQSKPQMCCLQ